jgi:hypothetical protein
VDVRAGGNTLIAGFPDHIIQAARNSLMSADVAAAAGGERVADPQAHGRADRQGGDVADTEPPDVAGLDLVTARAAAQRAGVEAYRARLAHQSVARVGR